MCPCNGCESRADKCHSLCEDYIKFRKMMDEKLDARNKVRSIDFYLRTHKKTYSRKRNRRQG